MSRYRKITPVNIAEREIILKEKMGVNRTMMQRRPLKRTPGPSPLLSLINLKNDLLRSFENKSSQEVICQACSSVRGVCGQIRTFTNDLDKLLSSVESFAPVVETVVSSYARSTKNKEKTTEQDKNPINTENLMRNTEEKPIDSGSTKAINNTSPPVPSKMPSEEELKEFLNNPLVSMLLQTLTQRLAAPK